MTASYLDTSALVKRYVDEAGSIWLRALVDPALQSLIIVSRLLIAEMTGAFNRRVREGALSRAEYARLEAAVQSDCLNEYHIYSRSPRESLTRPAILWNAIPCERWTRFIWQLAWRIIAFLLDKDCRPSRSSPPMIACWRQQRQKVWRLKTPFIILDLIGGNWK